MVDNAALNDILDEFWQVVFDTYGTYCDAWQGVLEREKSLKNLPEEIKNMYAERLEEIKEKAKTDPMFEDILKNFGDNGVSISEFSYCRYVPASMKDEVKDRILPQFSYEDMLDRNKMNGANHKYIGNMCVVTIYQYWEDNYRKKLSKSMNLDHNQCIASDIFGDIRTIRRSIIHNNGKAVERIPKNSSEAWFEKGDDVFIDRFKFENSIIDEIYAFVKEFKLNPHKFIQTREK